MSELMAFVVGPSVRPFSITDQNRIAYKLDENNQAMGATVRQHTLLFVFPLL
jgi:hypothetical protein